MPSNTIWLILAALIVVNECQPVIENKLDTENSPDLPTLYINSLLSKLYEAANRKILNYIGIKIARKFNECEFVFVDEASKWLKFICERKSLKQYQ